MKIEITFWETKVDPDFLLWSEQFRMPLVTIKQDLERMKTRIKRIKPDMEAYIVKYESKRRLLALYKRRYFKRHRGAKNERYFNNALRWKIRKYMQNM